MSPPKLRPVHSKEQRGDAEIIGRVAEGDLESLGELYDRYARDVWRAIRRSIDDDGDVEDLVHGMFLKLPQIARSYDGRANCRAWLCGIAVHLAMRHRRGVGRFRRKLASFAQSLVRSAPGDPEREASANEELAQFGQALARLSAKKRAVYVLVELEGLTVQDAAKALEIPAATGRTRLFHARRELQAVLTQEKR